MTGGEIGDAGELHQGVEVLRVDLMQPDDEILHQGIVDDACRLPHVTERFAQRGWRVLSDVKAVQKDRSPIRFSQSRDQAKQRAFAGARSADDGDALAGLDRRRYVVDLSRSLG